MYEIGDSLSLFVVTHTVYSEVILFYIFKDDKSAYYNEFIADLTMTDNEIMQFLLDCKVDLYGNKLQEID